MLKKISVAAVIGVLGLVSYASASSDGKVYVCHLTSSVKNPIVIIYVSVNSLPAHLEHGDYILPDGQADCSGGGDPIPL